VMVSGLPPIRARKLRYYQDRNFLRRLCPAPILAERSCATVGRAHDWHDIRPVRPDPSPQAQIAPEGKTEAHTHSSSRHPRKTTFFAFVTGLDDGDASCAAATAHRGTRDEGQPLSAVGAFHED
ncbi:MAG: hypothetical protein KGO02_04290, partial [Alphaproteobacteria bacterium]|nr:hypothetical protein [Alphaproteobacteria bacterium]